MQNGPTSLFRRQGENLIPSELVRGPWSHDQQHGGAVSGALGFAVTEESLRAEDAADFQLARLTVEILRPVPTQPLAYRAETIHRGRRSRVISAELRWNGKMVARASSQWVSGLPGHDDGPAPVTAQPIAPAETEVPHRPDVAADPGASDIGYPRPGFNCDVFEMRCQQGSTEDPGPGVIWVRMKTDLVAGADAHPALALATMADLGNAVGWDWSPNGRPMVNADITLQLMRYPTGAWVCLQSASRVGPAGIGIMETRLWDDDGQFGVTLSTSMESAVPLTIDLPGQ